MFIEGFDLWDDRLVGLAEIVGSLRFIPTSERPVEGQHAKIHRRGQGRFNHTEQYMSYFVRSPEMIRHLEGNPDEVLFLGRLAGMMPNAYRAVESLGLATHPSVTEERSDGSNCNAHRMTRHPTYAKVIYHSDQKSLFAGAPPIEMDDDMDSDGDPPLPARDGKDGDGGRHDPDQALHERGGEGCDRGGGSGSAILGTPSGNGAASSSSAPSSSSASGCGSSALLGSASASSSGVVASVSSCASGSVAFSGHDGKVSTSGVSSGSRDRVESAPAHGHGPGGGSSKSQGGVSGEEPPRQPDEDGGKRLILTRHHGSKSMLKKYLVSHLQGRLKSQGGDYFSVRMEGSLVFETLQSRLRSLHTADAADDMSLTRVAATGVHEDMLAWRYDDLTETATRKAKAFSDICKNNVFCKLVRQAPGRLKRHHIRGEIGFDSKDNIVSLHSCCEIDLASTPPLALVDVESARVDDEGLSPTMVVNFASFTLPQLMRMRFWTHGENVEYVLKQDDIGNCVPDECREVAPALFKALVEEGEVCVSGIDPLRSSLVECLQAQLVLTDNDDDILKLTELGKKCLKACVTLHSPCRAAYIREGVPFRT